MSLVPFLPLFTGENSGQTGMTPSLKLERTEMPTAVGFISYCSNLRAQLIAEMQGHLDKLGSQVMNEYNQIIRWLI